MHLLADVIYHVADGIATAGGCGMADVNASGRWKNHKVDYLSFSSEVLNRTSSRHVADGICPHFYLGMDH